MFAAQLPDKKPLAWSRSLPVLAALLSFASAGCLDFQKESCIIVFQPEQDEAQALLVYEGFQVAGKGDKDLKAARDELKELLAAERTFYLGALLFRIRLVLPDNKDQKITEGQRRANALLPRHLSIRKGAFFTSNNGQLCGYQTITIRQVARFVDGLNSILSESLLEHYAAVQASANQKTRSTEQLAVDRVIRKAAQDGHKWFRIEPGRLSLTIPGAPEMYKPEKRGIIMDELVSAAGLGEFRGNPSKPIPDKNVLQKMATTASPDVIRKALEGFDDLAAFLSDVPLSLDQRTDRITISLGYGEGQPIQFVFPYDSRKPLHKTAELVSFAQTLGVEFKKDMTADRLIIDFRKEHSAPRRP
jgi:hypothetical protein